MEYAKLIAYAIPIFIGMVALNAALDYGIKMLINTINDKKSNKEV